MESYVVHTNYDEYAIFLTKKLSRRHGPTITAKLYGKGPELGVGGDLSFGEMKWGSSRSFAFSSQQNSSYGKGRNIHSPWRR